MKQNFVAIVFFASFCLLPVFGDAPIPTTAPQEKSQSEATVEPTHVSHEQYWSELENREEATLKKAPDIRSLFYKTVLLLITVVGILLSASYFVKRMTGAKLNGVGSEGAIRLVERKYLSPKCSIWLVEAEGQKLLVAENQSGVAIQMLKTTEGHP